MFGLVLEGGGTKGAYHVGAYNAICELGIDVGCIVGTSIGAINGALFVQGEIEIVENLWDSISANDIIALPKDTADKENILDIKNIQALYKEIKNKKGLDITPLDNLLRHFIDEDKVRNSKIDFGLATFDIKGVKEKQIFIHDIPHGKLVDYLVASASLPIFQPKEIDDAIFVDGAFANNLPADMLIKAGYRDIISVEVGGIGKSKNISGAGCNIISVKCTGGAVKTLDFSHQYISEAKEIGYYETLKAFGNLSGEIYYFKTDNYISSKIRYSDKLIYGLEHAAECYGIDKFRVYTVEQLIECVLEKFENAIEYDSIIKLLNKSDADKLTALARAILREDAEFLNKGTIAGLLGDLFDAASAVAYFVQSK